MALVEAFEQLRYTREQMIADLMGDFQRQYEVAAKNGVRESILKTSSIEFFFHSETSLNSFFLKIIIITHILTLSLTHSLIPSPCLPRLPALSLGTIH